MSAPKPTASAPNPAVSASSPITESAEPTPLLLPVDAHAEKMYLSLLLRHGRQVLEVASAEPEHFYTNRYRVPFEAAKRLHEEGKEVSPDLVIQTLEPGQVSGVGGVEFLEGLAADCTGNREQALRVAPTYLLVMADTLARRKMIHAMQKGAAIAADRGQVASKALSASLALVEEAVTPVGDDGSMSSLDNVLADVMGELDEGMTSEKDIAGFPSGLIAWDLAIGGLHPSSVNIIAGRPGAGKTAALLTIALNCANYGLPVLVFSLEMSKRALGKRIITSKTGIPYNNIGTRNVTRAERAMAARESDAIRHLNLKIVDDGDMTVKKIDAKIKRFAEKHCKGHPPIVLIDYAQIIVHDDSRKSDNEATILNRTVKQLQKVVKRYNAACVLLAQINRGVERREDKRPLMSDLEGSGGLEQVADTITLLYRKAYYERGEKQEDVADVVPEFTLSTEEYTRRQTAALSQAAANQRQNGESEEAEWLIEKARNGPRQVLMMTFNPARITFSSGSPFPKGF